MKLRIQSEGKVCIGHDREGRSIFANDLDVVEVADDVAALLIERKQAFAVDDKGKAAKAKSKEPGNG
jgi:hypothetical protein